MGLDMYVIRKKRFSLKKEDYWDFQESEVYWRKANMVHKFFCDNCKEISEETIYRVTKKDLKALLTKCNEILEKVKTKKGKVANGYTINDEGEYVPVLEPGRLISNVDEISKILPTKEGFFFGNTEYNNYYLNDIKYTKKKIEELLSNGHFFKYKYYYLASF